MPRPYRIFVLVLASLAACGGSGRGSPLAPPPLGVADLQPAPNSTGIDPEVALRVTFSEAIDPLSVEGGAIALGEAGRVVPAHLEVAEDRRSVTLTPRSPLALDTEFRGQVDQRVRSASGRQLAAALAWSFTTRQGRWHAVAPVMAKSSANPPVLTQTRSGVAVMALGTEILALADLASDWVALDRVPAIGILDPKLTYLGVDVDDNLVGGMEGNATSRTVDAYVVHGVGFQGFSLPEFAGTATSLFLPKVEFAGSRQGELTLAISGCQTPLACGTAVAFSPPAKAGTTRWFPAGAANYGSFLSFRGDGDAAGRYFWLRHAATGVIDVVRRDTVLGTETRYELATGIAREALFQLALVATAPGRAFAFVGHESAGERVVEVHEYDPVRGFGAATRLWSGTGQRPTLLCAKAHAGHALLVLVEPLAQNTARSIGFAFDPRSGAWSQGTTLTDDLSRELPGTQAAAIAMAENGRAVIAFPQRDGTGTRSRLAVVHLTGNSGPSSLVREWVARSHGAFTRIAVAIDESGRSTLVWSDTVSGERIGAARFR